MNVKNNVCTAKMLCTLVITCLLSSGAFAQQAPQSIYRQKVASVSARVPGNSKTSEKDGPKRTQFSPQSGFVIMNYNVWNEGSFGITTSSWGSNPGNYSFNIRQSIQDSYADSFNLVANANLSNKLKADLRALLTTSYNANFNYASSLSYSHATIWMEVSAQGKGRTQGGSGITLNLDVELLPILPWCGSDQQTRQFIVNSTKSLIANALRNQPPPKTVISQFIDTPIRLLAQTGFQNIEILSAEAVKISPEIGIEVRNLVQARKDTIRKEIPRGVGRMNSKSEREDSMLAKVEDIEKLLKIKYSIDD